MAVVASATGVALGMTAGTIGAGLVGGAVLGAGAGALYSGLTGDGDILNSALTGALLGGAAGGIGAAFAPAAAGGAATTAPLTGAGALAPGAASTVSTPTAAMTAAKATAGGSMAGIPVGGAFTPTAGSAANFMLPNAVGTGMTGKQMLGAGLAGTTALSLLGNANTPKLSSTTGTTPSYIRPYTYSSTQPTSGGAYPSPYPSGPTYDVAGNPILDTRERNYFDQSYTAGEPYTAARGGLMAAYQAGGPVERMSQMNTAINPQGGLYPQGMIDKTQYALPTQRPTSMEVLDAGAQRMFAKGGKAEDEEESYKERMKRIKEMASMLDEIKETGRVAPPDLGEYTPTMREYKPSKLNLMAMPQAFVDAPDTKGVMGRIGGAYSLDRDTQLLGGLSGFAGKDRGALTVKPSTADVGIARRMGPGMLSAQYERSLTGQQPPRYMANYNIPYAEGGDVQGYNLGGYSDGGRLLRGPGDGVSDDIPATIGDRQPARLADGEFVIPARIVSELGNGSTDAGAKRLYAMMDRIQSGRKKTIGKNNVAKDSKAKKHLLA